MWPSRALSWIDTAGEGTGGKYGDGEAGRSFSEVHSAPEFNRLGALLTKIRVGHMVPTDPWASMDGLAGLISNLRRNHFNPQDISNRSRDLRLLLENWKSASVGPVFL